MGVSGSLVWKTSWEEEEEITAAVTVDTTREDTTREDTIKDTTRVDTIRTNVSVTTSRHSKTSTATLTGPAGELTRLDELGATPQDTAAPMPDNLRDFQTIPGLTRHAHPLADSRGIPVYIIHL